MNDVHLIGNLARDPELRQTTGENPTSVCRFTIGVNDGYGDKQRTSFLRIVTFGKQAENCNKYLEKGRKVAIVGRVQSGSYTDKEGRKIYTTDIIARQVEFLGGGQNQSGSVGERKAEEPSTTPVEDFPDEGFFVPTDDEFDIPF